jgi:subtilisin family serine protease
MLRKACAAAAFAAVLMSSSAYSQADGTAGERAASASALHSKATRTGGKVRVIVEFGAPVVGTAMGEPAVASRDYVAALKSKQQDVIATHFADGASALNGRDRSLTRMDYAPQFAINATAAEIDRLASDPRVVRLHEDKLARPTLRHSLGLMKMTGTGGAAITLPGGGARGQGRAVAILDTGVLKTHEFLKGKVISEACYNTAYALYGSTSRCPGGAPASTAVGSGADCATSVASGCGHGTHVAGIAAGYNAGTGGASANEPVSGVASVAKVVAINVFSNFSRLSQNSPCFGASTNCLLSYQSDQIKALERVYALRGGVLVGSTRYTIDAVNMSLGGDVYTGFCNTDPLKPMIDRLRGVGIATVIASGNEYQTDAVASPGCIQTAITVGASTKKAVGYPERIAYYSNQGPQVDVLAPGGDTMYPSVSVGPTNAILSSVVSGGYAGYQGTSMAAPHVAGAIAAIRSRPACRSKTVAQIESAIASTGLLILDHRFAASGVHLKERRIDVPAAMKKMLCFS